jgi:hypothetical protein
LLEAEQSDFFVTNFFHFFGKTKMGKILNFFCKTSIIAIQKEKEKKNPQNCLTPRVLPSLQIDDFFL